VRPNSAPKFDRARCDTPRLGFFVELAEILLTANVDRVKGPELVADRVEPVKRRAGRSPIEGHPRWRGARDRRSSRSRARPPGRRPRCGSLRLGFPGSALLLWWRQRGRRGRGPVASAPLIVHEHSAPGTRAGNRAFAQPAAGHVWRGVHSLAELARGGAHGPAGIVPLAPLTALRGPLLGGGGRGWTAARRGIRDSQGTQRLRGSCVPSSWPGPLPDGAGRGWVSDGARRARAGPGRGRASLPRRAGARRAWRRACACGS
jgi:hypothetical protein